jgi:hypothetical protein
MKEGEEFSKTSMPGLTNGAISTRIETGGNRLLSSA